MTLKLKNGRVRYYQLLFIVKRNNNQMLRKANLPLVFTASCWTWPIFWNQPSQTAQANSKTHDDACWTDVSHNTVYDHSQMLSHNVDGDGPWQGTYLGEFCLTCIPRSSVASHFFNETGFFLKGTLPGAGHWLLDIVYREEPWREKGIKQHANMTQEVGAWIRTLIIRNVRWRCSSLL